MDRCSFFVVLPPAKYVIKFGHSHNNNVIYKFSQTETNDEFDRCAFIYICILVSSPKSMDILPTHIQSDARTSKKKKTIKKNKREPSWKTAKRWPSVIRTNYCKLDRIIINSITIIKFELQLDCHISINSEIYRCVYVCVKMMFSSIKATHFWHSARQFAVDEFVDKQQQQHMYRFHLHHPCLCVYIDG